jgi:hypothetical protein
MASFKNHMVSLGPNLKKIFRLRFLFILFLANGYGSALLPAGIFGIRPDYCYAEITGESAQVSQVLNAKIRAKESFGTIYWNEREKTDWNDDIRKWRLGFLDDDASQPPLVIFKENFFRSPNDNFYWINNGANLKVINPFDKIVTTDLIFSARAGKKDSFLQVFVNNEFKGKIAFPYTKDSADFEEVTIKNISLRPGKNEINFYGSGKTDVKISPAGAKYRKRSLGIKLNEDVRFGIKSFGKNSLPDYFLPNAYFEDGDSIDMLFERGKEKDNVFLMSRSLDVDLEEYPYFILSYTFLDNYSQNLGFFFGIDLNNDGRVDGYVSPSGIQSGNLLESVREKWKSDDWHSYSSFIVKSLVIAMFKKDSEEIGGPEEDQDEYFNFSLENLNFYSDETITVQLSDLSLKDIKIGGTGCTYSKRFVKYPVSRNDRKKSDALAVNIFYKKETVAPSVAEESTVSAEKELKPPKNIKGYPDNPDDPSQKSAMELKLPVALPSQNKDRDTYLSFSYLLQDEDSQRLSVFLAMDENKDGTIDKRVFIPLQKEDDLAGRNLREAEINLNKFYPDLDKIKEVIFQINKQGEVSENAWRAFYLKDDIKIYRKYPAVIKNKRLKDSLVSELSDLDVPILEIDGKKLGFSQINNKSWALFEDDIADFGKFALNRGNHKIKLLGNDFIKIEWAALETADKRPAGQDKNPQIIFKKLNQSKYIVQIRQAKDPFWLVFQESYDPDWKIFYDRQSEFKESNIIGVAEAGLKAAEADYRMKWELFDWQYLFINPLPVQHYSINFYANGWYIDPEELNLPEDFQVVLYFRPQALFNIGFILSSIFLSLCVIGLFCLRAKNEKS